MINGQYKQLIIYYLGADNHIVFTENNQEIFLKDLKPRNKNIN